MGDQLEQFVIKNKDSFNELEPSEKVWKGVEKKVGQRKGFLQIAWKVAAVLFMVSTVYLLIDRSTDEPQLATYIPPALSGEFQAAEDYYTQLISLKREEIEAQLSLEEQDAFLLDIDQLDILYDELRSTYRRNTVNDRVVDAMIHNLQLRLEILNRQLDILESIKDQKNESEKTINI